MFHANHATGSLSAALLEVIEDQSEGLNMRVFSRFSALFTAAAVALALLVPTLALVSDADARAGGGFSSGSRGMRTWSAPAPTNTAPSAARPFDRTITPNAPSYAPGAGGFFGRPGLLGGLAAGFLGAGLFGLLFGGGMFGGLGGFSSLLGLLLQIVLIVFVARLVMGWWRRRNLAFAGPSHFDAPPQSPAGGFGFGLGGARSAAPIEITPRDYDAFDRLLSDIQSAWSREDIPALAQLTTPEMESYFARDLAANKAKGVVNQVANVKLLQGDLSEAWREGTTDYATVAMRFRLVDRTVDQQSGHMVGGSDQPQEVTEVWTFARTTGSDWILSAIQQV
jgi:predicted lipid-binding transport protein (Tim44 family)